MKSCLIITSTGITPHTSTSITPHTSTSSTPHTSTGITPHTSTRIDSNIKCIRYNVKLDVILDLHRFQFAHIIPNCYKSKNKQIV
jgi:hypothetical protein